VVQPERADRPPRHAEIDLPAIAASKLSQSPLDQSRNRLSIERSNPDKAFREMTTFALQAGEKFGAVVPLTQAER
jgi:hypothetical protein